jgi:hypothetical protein
MVALTKEKLAEMLLHVKVGVSQLELGLAEIKQAVKELDEEAKRELLNKPG